MADVSLSTLLSSAYVSLTPDTACVLGAIFQPMLSGKLVPIGAARTLDTEVEVAA